MSRITHVLADARKLYGRMQHDYNCKAHSSREVLALHRDMLAVEALILDLDALRARARRALRSRTSNQQPKPLKRRNA